MKNLLIVLFLIGGLNGFSQNDKSHLEKETKETLDWINSKFIEHQFESSDTKQVQSFKEVKEIDGQSYLIGEHIQDTDKGWGFSRLFFIPIEKINSITFVDKPSNIWLVIRMKENEKAVLEIRHGENWTKLDNFNFILAKSIDHDDLRPRIKKAFNYLMKLYGNNTEEKF
ncbi:hypothetical protein ACJRPK_09965 [Aquimarina sp. 2-A2]|uniref:hypothetical protein n=1 Tax=Aquimarina sp. 2-A2 TaxID=3382644 RepID=UPI00387F29E8